jgi:hypothetical protein
MVSSPIVKTVCKLCKPMGDRKKDLGTVSLVDTLFSFILPAKYENRVNYGKNGRKTILSPLHVC